MLYFSYVPYCQGSFQFCVLQHAQLNANSARSDVKKEAAGTASASMETQSELTAFIFQVPKVTE